jgi:hypothetical protein
MIGYLCHGTPERAFTQLAAELQQPLQLVVEFAARPHRTSHHIRQSTPELRLHHLMMTLR